MKKTNLRGLVAVFCVMVGCTVTTGNGANAQAITGSDFLSKLGRTLEGDRNAFARKPVEPAASNPTPQASVVSSGNTPASSSPTNKLICDEVSLESTLDVDVAYARIMRTFKPRTAEVHAKELEVMLGYESEWLKTNFRHQVNTGVYYNLGDQVRLNLDGTTFVINQTEPFFGAAVFELAKDKPMNIHKAKYCVSYGSATNEALLASYRQKAKAFVTKMLNAPEVAPQAAETATVKATVTAPIVEVSSTWTGGGVETGTASTWGTMHVGGFNLYCDEVRVQSNLDVDVAYSRVMRNFRLTSQAEHANRLEQNVVSNWVMRHFQHTAQPGIYYKLGDEVRVSLDGAQYVPKQKSPYFYLTQFELAKDAPRNLFMGRYCLTLSYETGDALKASSIAKAKSVVTALFN